MSMFTRTNPTDGTVLHGEVLAAPDDPKAVIAIVHGFGEHIGRYAPFAKALGARGFALLGLDLHGHGRTEGRRGYVGAYERLREDVDALLDEARQRFPEVPLYLWGHSMGGGLVLDYGFERDGGVLTTALCGVIATAPLIEAADPPPAPLFALLRLMEKLAPRFVIRNPIKGEQISALPEEQARYEADPLNHDRLTLRLGLNILEIGQALEKRNEAFPIPLLLMHAKEDTLTRFESSAAFASKRPSCNFHPFDDVAHELHNDSSRDAVIDLMGEFIRETSPTCQGDRG